MTIDAHLTCTADVQRLLRSGGFNVHFYGIPHTVTMATKVTVRVIDFIAITVHLSAIDVAHAVSTNLLQAEFDVWNFPSELSHKQNEHETKYFLRKFEYLKTARKRSTSENLNTSQKYFDTSFLSLFWLDTQTVTLILAFFLWVLKIYFFWP